LRESRTLTKGQSCPRGEIRKPASPKRDFNNYGLGAVPAHLPVTQGKGEERARNGREIGISQRTTQGGKGLKKQEDQSGKKTGAGSWKRWKWGRQTGGNRRLGLRNSNQAGQGALVRVEDLPRRSLGGVVRGTSPVKGAIKIRKKKAIIEFIGRRGRRGLRKERNAGKEKKNVGPKSGTPL